MSSVPDNENTELLRTRSSFPRYGLLSTSADAYEFGEVPGTGTPLDDEGGEDDHPDGPRRHAPYFGWSPSFNTPHDPAAVNMMGNMFPVRQISSDDIDVMAPNAGTLAMQRSGVTSGATPKKESQTAVFGLSRTDNLQKSFFFSPAGQNSAMMNLVCSTLGASILPIPQAFSLSGLLMGPLFLSFCALGTIYSVYLLVRAAEVTGALTYEGVAWKLFGPSGKRFTEIVMITFCFGVCVAYITAIRDTLAVFQGLPWLPAIFAGRLGLGLMTGFFWAVFVLPLSMVRGIASLRYASLASVLCCAYIGIFVTGHLIFRFLSFYQPGGGGPHALHASNSGHRHHGHKAPSDVESSSWWYASGIELFRSTSTMLVAAPVMMFSFCCQPNCLEVHHTMKRATVKKTTQTTAKAVAACSFLYIITGVCGYLEFGNAVDGNILAMFNPQRGIAAPLAFAATLMATTLAIPLCVLPTRESLTLFFEEESIHKYHAVITFIIAFAALILGLFVPGLTFIFGMLGGVCGSLIGFILPAMFALASGIAVSRADIFGAWALLISGVLLGSIGTWCAMFS